MQSLEKKAKEKLCLTCGDVYEPAYGCSPAEYPHCAVCNLIEARKLSKLPKITLTEYSSLSSRPGKRNGKKTEVVNQKKRELNPRPKRTFIVNEKGVYEKNI